MWAALSNSLLANKIWPKEKPMTSEATLSKAEWSLTVFSGSLSLGESVPRSCGHLSCRTERPTRGGRWNLSPATSITLAITWKRLPQPMEPSGGCIPGDVLTAALWERSWARTQNPSAHLVLNIWDTEMMKITNLGKICYIALRN